MFDGIIDTIWQKILDWWAGLADLAYLGGWYAIGLAILVGFVFISISVGGFPIIGKWIRGIGGAAVLLYGAFLAGLTVMFNRDRKRREAEKQREADRKAKEAKPWSTPWPW